MRRHLLACVVLACLALAGLSGCRGSEATSPSTAPPISPIPTPTTSAAPVLPEAASKNTKAGAIAFVKHYVSAVNHALETGDTSAVAALSDADCKACKRLISNVTKVYAPGGSIQGGTCAIKDIRSSAFDEANWQVSVQCSFQPQVTTAGDGTTTRTKGTDGLLLFVVQAKSGMKVTSWSQA